MRCGRIGLVLQIEWGGEMSELRDMPVVTIEQVHRFREASLAENTKLQQERDEALAIVEVMRDSLDSMTTVFLDTEGNYGSYENNAIDKANKALSITTSSALAELKARIAAETLEEAATEARNNGNDILAMQLSARAEAKRKGE